MTNKNFELRVSENPDNNWDEFVSICEGTVYQSKAWAEIETRKKTRPLFFCWWDNNGELAGIGTGQKTNSTVPLFASWNNRLSMGSTPAVRQKYRHDGTEFLLSLRDYAKRNGCRLLTIESHMGQELHVDIRRIKIAAQPRIEFRINLIDDEDDIWNHVSKHHRRKINKARRQDISIHSYKSSDAVQTLRSLQISSHVRRVHRGEQIRLGSDEPIIEFMQEILDREVGKLYLAEVAGEPISGALISIYRSQVYYVFGGSSQKGFSLNAPGLLFWEMIKQCRSDGCLEFNLGGVPAEAVNPESQAHGLYRFKNGFGGETVNRADYSINLRPIISAVANAGSKLLRHA